MGEFSPALARGQGLGGCLRGRFSAKMAAPFREEPEEEYYGSGGVRNERYTGELESFKLAE
jgi:hypothetical protein